MKQSADKAVTGPSTLGVMRRAGVWGCVSGACIIVAACSPSSSATSATVVAESSPVETTEVVDGDGATDDGRLVIGILLPSSGPGVEIGTSMRGAAELAIDQINRAGGVNGGPVRTEVADEGDTAVNAARSVAQLLERDVDAIIGPASSVIATTTLPLTTEAGVLTCSPSASALALADYPDRGLFIRTLPTDALQAAAMANQMEATGYRTASIMFIDDSYGRDFAEVLYDELTAKTIVVDQLVAFEPSDEDYLDEAEPVVEAEVIAVIGDNDAGVRMVDALFEAGDDRTEIVVNDAMRVPSTSRAYRGLSDIDRQHLRGVSPRSQVSGAKFKADFMAVFPDSRGLFAINAYDCVNVIALAANIAGTTDALQLAQHLADVTTDGTSCAAFAVCDMLRVNQRDINYDGPSGQLELGVDGDPVFATFDLFGYDPAGNDVSIGEVSSR